MNLEQRCWLASGRYGPRISTQEFEAVPPKQWPALPVPPSGGIKAVGREWPDPRNPGRLATFYR